MIRACHAAGRDITVLVSVLDGGIARWTKKQSPGTITVVRPVWPDEPPTQNGLLKFNLAWFNEQIRPIREFLQWIDFIQFYNEKHDNLAQGDVLKAERDFNWECGYQTGRLGTHATLLNLAMGNLADDRHVPKEPDQFAVMVPMLDERCRAGDVLMYHPYNAVATPYDPEPGFEHNAGRFIHWCKLVPSLRVIGGEALVPEWKDPATGQDARLQSPEQTVWQMRQFDRLIDEAIARGDLQPDQFLGYAPFTGQPGDRWKNFDMEPVYQAQQAYLLE